jgi:hypothetical protein
LLEQCSGHSGCLTACIERASPAVKRTIGITIAARDRVIGRIERAPRELGAEQQLVGTGKRTVRDTQQH